MDMQNVSNLQIPEGAVRTIHDKDSRLIWGRLAYDTKYVGDTYQQTYSGKNLFDGTYVNYAIGGGSGHGWFANANSRSAVIKCSPNTVYSIKKYETSNRFVICDYPTNPTATTEINLLLSDSTLNEATVTTHSDAEYLFVFVSNASGEPQMQIEQNSSPTSYEPYTGGIPSPNPDYPQAVQTVTGEQTVTVTGKNMYAGSQDFSGTWTNSTSWNTDTETYNGLVVKYKADAWNGLYKKIKVEAGKTYTFSAFIKAGSARNVNFYLGGGGATVSPSSKSISITTEWQRYSVTFAVSGSGTVHARIENTSNQTTPTYVCGYQLEESGSMTAYEPYQSQSYTINLSSIKFCKISDSPDYIYNSGNDWYVHKEYGERTVDTSAITLRSSYSNIDYAVIAKPSDSVFYGNYQEMQYPLLYTHAEHSSPGGNFNNASYVGKIFMSGQSNNYWVGFTKNTSLDSIKSILNGATLYYPLAAPTDTQITDATLIGQLNAIHEWMTRYGYNSVVTGNLPIIIDRTNL